MLKNKDTYSRLSELLIYEGLNTVPYSRHSTNDSYLKAEGCSQHVVVHKYCGM